MGKLQMFGNLWPSLVELSQQGKPAVRAITLEAWDPPPYPPHPRHYILDSSQRNSGLWTPTYCAGQSAKTEITYAWTKQHQIFQRATTKNKLCMYKIAQHTKHFPMQRALSVLTTALLGHH